MLSDQTCSELHTQLLFTTGLVLQENVWEMVNTCVSLRSQR